MPVPKIDPTSAMVCLNQSIAQSNSLTSFLDRYYTTMILPVFDPNNAMDRTLLESHRNPPKILILKNLDSFNVRIPLTYENSTRPIVIYTYSSNTLLSFRRLQLSERNLILTTLDQSTELAELLALQWLCKVVGPHLVGRHVFNSNFSLFNLIGHKEITNV